MYTAGYNPNALPGTSSPSSHSNLWLNKDNYSLLDYILPIYNLSPNNIVGATYTPKVVTASSTYDNVVPDPLWN